jgi:hypothetical protein
MISLRYYSEHEVLGAVSIGKAEKQRLWRRGFVQYKLLPVIAPLFFHIDAR